MHATATATVPQHTCRAQIILCRLVVEQVVGRLLQASHTLQFVSEMLHLDEHRSSTAQPVTVCLLTAGL